MFPVCILTRQGSDTKSFMVMLFSSIKSTWKLGFSVRLKLNCIICIFASYCACNVNVFGCLPLQISVNDFISLQDYVGNKRLELSGQLVSLLFEVWSFYSFFSFSGLITFHYSIHHLQLVLPLQPPTPLVFPSKWTLCCRICSRQWLVRFRRQ